MPGKVFFVTGTTTGFGHYLVKHALAKGDYAVATARNASKLASAFGSEATEKNFLPISLDVTDPKSVDSAFKAAVDKFKRIDVVVNNAGFGLCGPFETLTDAQIRKQMEVNFFGLINCTRRALEVMREQKPAGGVIQQVTSIGGLNGVPTFSVYCASKFAVEGFTEALSKEIKPEWNIKLTCVEPGGFRTSWSGDNMEYGDQNLSTYDHIDARKAMSQRHGTQVGDPQKAAVQMYELAIESNPPLRCILGSDAHKVLTERLDAQQKLVKDNEKRTLATDYGKGV